MSRKLGTATVWGRGALIGTVTLVTLSCTAARESDPAQDSDHETSNFDDMFENVSKLTAEETAAYGNRAHAFSQVASKFRPDLDFRDVLGPELADEEPQWSQGYEELIIRDFFGGKKEGVFVDVGCYLPRELSTTYYLEDQLGWTGIGIDAQRKFATGWKKDRPRSTFVATAISDTDGETLTLFIAGTTASLEKWAMEIFTKDLEEIQVKTITLDTLLDMHVIDKVDFLSIDIDGAEISALKGFDIQRFKPDLCGIEAAKPELVKEYFAANGYELIEKYLKVDKINLYFRPKPAKKGSGE
jgi:FkbM family methyltransferase